MKFKFTTLTIHEARGETIEEIVAEVKHRTVMFSQNMFPLVRRTRTVVLHCYKRIDVASSKKLRNWPVSVSKLEQRNISLLITTFIYQLQLVTDYKIVQGFCDRSVCIIRSIKIPDNC